MGEAGFHGLLAEYRLHSGDRDARPDAIRHESVEDRLLQSTERDNMIHQPSSPSNRGPPGSRWDSGLVEGIAEQRLSSMSLLYHDRHLDLGSSKGGSHQGGQVL